MKRYSKKVRDEAALICAIAASGGVWTERGYRRTRVYADIFDALGNVSKDALDLACSAYATGFDVAWDVELDAELSSKILCGWSPP